jgi:hypothetical protein
VALNFTVKVKLSCTKSGSKPGSKASKHQVESESELTLTFVPEGSLRLDPLTLWKGMSLVRWYYYDSHWLHHWFVPNREFQVGNVIPLHVWTSQWSSSRIRVRLLTNLTFKISAIRFRPRWYLRLGLDPVSSFSLLANLMVQESTLGLIHVGCLRLNTLLGCHWQLFADICV